MFKRPKLISGILWFVLAGLNIAIHVTQYKRDEKPSGLRLVMATLNIMTGILSLMSDALDRKHLAAADTNVISGEDEIEEFDIDGEMSEDGDICDGNCEDCQG